MSQQNTTLTSLWVDEGEFFRCTFAILIISPDRVYESGLRVPRGLSWKSFKITSESSQIESKVSSTLIVGLVNVLCCCSVCLMSMTVCSSNCLDKHSTMIEQWVHAVDLNNPQVKLNQLLSITWWYFVTSIQLQFQFVMIYVHCFVRNWQFIDSLMLFESISLCWSWCILAHSWLQLGFKFPQVSIITPTDRIIFSMIDL